MYVRGVKVSMTDELFTRLKQRVWAHRATGSVDELIIFAASVLEGIEEGRDTILLRATELTEDQLEEYDCAPPGRIL